MSFLSFGVNAACKLQKSVSSCRTSQARMLIDDLSIQFRLSRKSCPLLPETLPETRWCQAMEQGQLAPFLIETLDTGSIG